MDTFNTPPGCMYGWIPLCFGSVFHIPYSSPYGNRTLGSTQGKCYWIVPTPQVPRLQVGSRLTHATTTTSSIGSKCPILKPPCGIKSPVIPFTRGVDDDTIVPRVPVDTRVSFAYGGTTYPTPIGRIEHTNGGLLALFVRSNRVERQQNTRDDFEEFLARNYGNRCRCDCCWMHSLYTSLEDYSSVLECSC